MNITIFVLLIVWSNGYVEPKRLFASIEECKDEKRSLKFETDNRRPMGLKCVKMKGSI
jgi:hypothetical protein